VREELTIQRQGKTYILYAGLLDAAHQAGLKSIDTELLQAPVEANGGTAIVRAVVEMEGGQRFSGLGDANPENVGKMVAPHLLRQAETRAKARALRDAINSGTVALEELGEDNPEDKAGAEAPDNGSSTQGPVRSLDRAASEETVEMLQAAIQDSGRSIDAFEDHYRCPIHEVSEGLARKWIEKLSGEDSSE